QAGVVETEGPVLHPETGTPQGGPVSPVLAHGSLHDALDRWCDTVGKAHGRGEALVCRDADDWVGACRSQDAAARFARGLPQRLKPWAQRLQAPRSRATVVRRCALPKAHGTARPRGIPALADTLGHLACATRLTAISAQDVLACSAG